MAPGTLSLSLCLAVLSLSSKQQPKPTSWDQNTLLLVQVSGSFSLQGPGLEVKFWQVFHVPTFGLSVGYHQRQIFIIIAKIYRQIVGRFQASGDFRVRIQAVTNLCRRNQGRAGPGPCPVVLRGGGLGPGPGTQENMPDLWAFLPACCKMRLPSRASGRTALGGPGKSRHADRDDAKNRESVPLWHASTPPGASCGAPAPRSGPPRPACRRSALRFAKILRDKLGSI